MKWNNFLKGMNEMIEGKMLTPEEIAEWLEITPATVRGWLRSGRLKGYKLGAKAWRVKQSDLDEFMEAARAGNDDA